MKMKSTEHKLVFDKTIKLVPLTNDSRTLIIDADDYKKVSEHKWHTHKTGYKNKVRIRNSKGVYIHKFIIGEEGCTIRHKNRDVMDNRKSNLQVIN